MSPTRRRFSGYPWFVSGEVIHGEKRGRDLGFPTANLRLDPGCGLRHGIYAVRVAVDGKRYGGVASFGRRPTFDNGAPLLETFLFDFSGDLYGKTIDVAFIGWIRPEEKFASVDDLVKPHERGRPAGEGDAGGGRGCVSAAGERRLIRLTTRDGSIRLSTFGSAGYPCYTARHDRQTCPTRPTIPRRCFCRRPSFPMRAGLPQKEPELLARWDKIDLYKRLREAAKASRNSSCTTARLTPTATSISATRSTRSSRTW